VPNWSFCGRGIRAGFSWAEADELKARPSNSRENHQDFMIGILADQQSAISIQSLNSLHIRRKPLKRGGTEEMEGFEFISSDYSVPLCFKGFAVSFRMFND
jgi:hypothetical protein